MSMRSEQPGISRGCIVGSCRIRKWLEALVGMDTSGVVPGLTRDRTDLGSNEVFNVIGRTIRPVENCPDYGQALNRQLTGIELL